MGRRQASVVMLVNLTHRDAESVLVGYLFVCTGSRCMTALTITLACLVHITLLSFFQGLNADVGSGHSCFRLPMFSVRKSLLFVCLSSFLSSALGPWLRPPQPPSIYPCLVHIVSFLEQVL